MADKTKLKNIIAPELLAEISRLVDYLVETDAVAESAQLIEIIERIFQEQKQLKQLYPEVHQQYKEFLLKAKFIALPRLRQDDILYLLERYFTIVYRLTGYDPGQKIKQKLMTYDDLAVRDGFKKRIRDALLKNQTVLTTAKLTIGGKSEAPTIANWLRDYTVETGLKPVDKLEQSQYLFNSKNARGLKPEEKKRLELLFNFYEQLKYSSTRAAGLEESVVAILPSGEISLISGGRPEKINPEVLKIYRDIKNKENSGVAGLRRLEEMASQYQEGSLEREALQEEINQSKTIGELKEIAQQYRPDSLEAKAIEEEIKKLEARGL